MYSVLGVGHSHLFTESNLKYLEDVFHPLTAKNICKSAAALINSLSALPNDA